MSGGGGDLTAAHDAPVFLGPGNRSGVSAGQPSVYHPYLFISTLVILYEHVIGVCIYKSVPESHSAADGC